jgi:hypothetical protein
MRKFTPILIFGTILLFFVIKIWIRHRDLEDSHRYTVGAFFRISTAVDGGPLGEFKFRYKGNEFTSDIVLSSKENIDLNVYYLVKFNPRNPKNSRIFITNKFKKDVDFPDTAWITVPQELFDNKY